MTHNLKIWPGSYEAIAAGAKHHDIRKCDDRTFAVGDSIIFREWNLQVYENMLDFRTKEEAEKAAYTGRTILRKISYISVEGSWGLPKGICVFSIK